MSLPGLLAWLRFETPGYLALLALLPLLVAMSRRSLAALGPGRRAAAIAARCLVVTLMVLALAGAQRARRIRDVTVLFLVDRSRSVPADLQREAFEFVRQAAGGRRAGDRVGVIAFDGAADIEQAPMAALELARLSEAAQPDQTNLAGAARLALALLPSDTTGRVVVLSDGNENVGAVLQEAERFAAAGVPIDVRPMRYEHSHEVVFESLRAPPAANVDETVNLHAVLRSQQPVTGKVLLYQNEQLVDLNGPRPGAGHAVELQPGPNRCTLPLELRAAGVHRFRAEFVPDEPGSDTLPDNNEGRAFTVVAGQGRVLVLTTADDLEAAQPSARLLAGALEAEGLECEVEVAGTQPLDQVRLLEYSAVVLSNVPADDIRSEEQQTLAVYVRELGGGLIMLGGDRSFGAGGWLGSPVEEVMPVSFDIKHKKEFLKGALVLCMHACEVERGNYIGERCAIDSVKTLSSRDLVGVLAWQWQGSQRGHWVVPLQEVGNRTAIINAIKKMSMGDMPDLDAVMRPAVQALLARKDVGPKHMIVISDFDPQAPRDDLIEMMRKGGVTCSTVAIGYGGHAINETLADSIARSTGGRFYRTNDFSKLPQIFVKESREIRRSLVQEVAFNPRLVNPLSPVVPGLAGAALPELGGLVLTTPRPLADVPITRRTEEGEDDPVLAHWQVGLGRTVAFTSGQWNNWGVNWTPWEKFGKLWAQIVRWASRPLEDAPFEVTTSVHGGRATVRLDARTAMTAAAEVGGTLVRPGNAAEPLRLAQTGPGRFEAEFDVRERGDYVLNLGYRLGHGPDAASGSLRTGLSIAYSPEYSQMSANLPLLDELRGRTGGRLLGPQDAARVFERSGLPAAEARRSIWETLVWWVLVLFLVDVAIRRVALHPAELARRARQLLAEMAGRGRPAGEAAAVLSTLKGARDRVREQEQAARQQAAAEAARPAATARYEPPTPDARASEDLSRALGGASQQDAPVVARPTGRKPTQTEADYTARLLRAKRRARDDMRQDGEPPA